MVARSIWRRFCVPVFLLLFVLPLPSLSTWENADAHRGGLVFSTFLGGSDEADQAWDVATDTNGNIYLIGDTFSPLFPVTNGAYDTTYSGGYDVFVAKLSADGTQLIWATYLGGTVYEYGVGIAVDNTGVYVTGQTDSTDFPVTSGAYDTSYNGGSSDVFVAKLSLDGSTLLWSTYLGGGEPQIPVTADYPFDLRVDHAGNVYVAGSTNATDFPTTAGAYDRDLSGSQDAFVTKLKADGSALLYSTYLGGSSHEYAHGLAVDKSGQAYITGRTYSTDYPTTAGAYDTSHNGEHDAYVTKLKSDGSGLVYSTFIGGSTWDIGLDLAVDNAYRLYVSGSTESSDFPTTEGVYDRTHNGRWDAFALQLTSDGKQLIYSTLLGGMYEDRASGISIDSLGSVYLVGDTISPNFPTTVGAYDESHNGSWDAFVVRFNANGSVLGYASFLGGHTWDEGHAISVDHNDQAIVVGRADSSTFPVTAGAYDTTFGPFRDAFVAKFTGVTPDIVVTGLEVTQGIQDVENDIPLVANRVTWARAYVEQASSEYPLDMARVTAELRAYQNGQVLPGSPARPWTSPTVRTDGGERLQLDDSYLFYVPVEWRSGPVTFSVEVNLPGYGHVNEVNLSNNIMTETLTFHDVVTPCLVMVPVHLHGDGGDITYHTSAIGFGRILRGFNRYHPIPNSVSWYNSAVLYPSGHDIGAEYDLSNGFDRQTLLQRVRWRNWWTDDPEEGCHYVGMVSPLADTTKGKGDVLGLARVGGKEVWVKMEDSVPSTGPYWFQEGAQTLGHELGHNKGLRHALCKGDEDDPDHAYPWEFNTCQLADIDTEGYYGFTSYYTTWGITRTVISNDPNANLVNRSYPVMGYKRPQWVSPWEYCKLLDTAYGVPCDLWNWNALEVTGSLLEHQASETLGPVARLQMAAEYLLVSGWIDVVTATAEIQDVYTLATVSAKMLAQAVLNISLAGVGSTYELVQIDSGGGVLDAQAISLSADDEPGATRLFFMELLPLASGTASIEVRQDVTTLAARVASAHPPALVLNSPQSGEIRSGTVISWTGTDDDGDDLAYDIFYSPDAGASWRPMVMGLTQNGWTVRDLIGIPGSQEGKIKVLANDGFHTTQVISTGMITVANSAPQPLILSPPDGLTHDAEAPLLLEGMAVDEEDGTIDDGFVWTSNLEGYLGDGQEWVTTLHPGIHQLTLTVVDMHGLSASDTVTVTVVQSAWKIELPLVLR